MWTLHGGNFEDHDGRHNRGANYLLADGHARWLLPERVLPGTKPPAAGKSYAAQFPPDLSIWPEPPVKSP
jgi:prepilin-type processing-associated H-X9-DG protein